MIEILSYGGEIWSVPVTTHRANVLWYNKAIFEDNNLQPPATVSDFFNVAATLDAAGITPLALCERWTMVHLLETALLGSLGADAYVGLWSGATGWGSAEVTTALNNFNRMLNYVNEDYTALSWDRATQLVIDGSAAMNIMGNWAKGYFKSQGWTRGVEFGWMPSPGSAGAFDALSDSFGLPKGAPNRDAAIAWLKVCGSKEGQALLCCSLGTLQTRKSSFLAVGLSRRLPHNSLVFSLRLRCRVTVVRPRRPPAMGPCGLVRGSWPRNAQESCSRYAGKSPQFKG